MDPTSLPTDNLYKFLALAGLALSGFCVWLRSKIGDRQLTEAAALTEKFMQWGASHSTLDPHATAELASLKVRTALLQGRWKRLSSVLPYAIAIGITFSLTGFYLWYAKLQRFTDEQTKADFEDHMAELWEKRMAREKARP